MRSISRFFQLFLKAVLGLPSPEHQKICTAIGGGTGFEAPAPALTPVRRSVVSAVRQCASVGIAGANSPLLKYPYGFLHLVFVLFSCSQILIA